MPSFDIVRRVELDEVPSFRVSSVMSNFDLDPEHIHEHFKGNIDIEGRYWSVGLIVGGSGTGKSTIARQLFPDAYVRGYDYSADSVIDDMPKDKSVKEIERVFTNVGFATPPSWLKPYSVLSNGEKMRVDLARAVLEDNELIVFDEFTSVVNREVAKTASHAIGKAVKRLGKRFIAVSCHKDITDWLEPDWIYDTDEKRFFTVGESSTAPRCESRSTGLTARLRNGSGRYSGSITI